jgi:hypothetical protein
MAKKLTITQLRFIDKYLKSSGVRYDDIRCELTDHVATALENMDGDFKDNFNRYMINNKRELLASNRAFKKLARDKALGTLKSTLLKPQLWAIALMLFTFSLVSGGTTEVDDIAINLEIISAIISSVLYFYFLFYKTISRKNFSVVNRLVTFTYCSMILFRADMLIDNKVALLLYYSFSITFFLFLMQSLYALNKTYKLQYHG